jgi:hypothetical protein
MMTRVRDYAKLQVFIAFLIGNLLTVMAFYLSPDPEYVIQFMCLVGFAISVGSLRTFYPIVLDSIQKKDVIDGSDLLSWGAFAKSLALTLLTGWVVLYKIYYGDLPYLRESFLLTYVLFLAAYGGVLYMTSEGALPGYIPRQEWVRAGKWVALGTFLFGLAILITNWTIHPPTKTIYPLPPTDSTP